MPASLPVASSGVAGPAALCSCGDALHPDVTHVLSLTACMHVWSKLLVSL